MSGKRPRGFAGDPFRELIELQQNINRLFDESFGAKAGESAALSAWTPPVDIFEDEGSFVLLLDLPGVSRDDIKVNLSENVLSVSGERRFEDEAGRDKYHRIERSYGQFFRSFTLPPNVDTEAMRAESKDGVLRLTLPKKREARPRQIEVKVQ
jgi:HSP20 family protein